MKEPVYSSVSSDLIGKEVTLTGIAVESKPGPCIKVDNDIVFIKNKQFWSEELLGQKILVTGKLSREKMIPDAKIDENGAISQGAAGEQYLIEAIAEIKKE